jgi:hypothetical protein
MARGGHGLPKVSLVPAMPEYYMPCGRATTETALQPFKGWPALKAGGLWPSSTPLNTPHRKPMSGKTGLTGLVAWPNSRNSPYQKRKTWTWLLECEHKLCKTLVQLCDTQTTVNRIYGWRLFSCRQVWEQELCNSGSHVCTNLSESKTV